MEWRPNNVHLRVAYYFRGWCPVCFGIFELHYPRLLAEEIVRAPRFIDIFMNKWRYVSSLRQVRRCVRECFNVWWRTCLMPEILLENSGSKKQGNVGDWAAVNYMSKKKDMTPQVVWFSYWQPTKGWMLNKAKLQTWKQTKSNRRLATHACIWTDGNASNKSKFSDFGLMWASNPPQMRLFSVCGDSCIHVERDFILKHWT